LEKQLQAKGYGIKIHKRLMRAKTDATRASAMDVEQRLQEFSFVARYAGKLRENKESKKLTKPSSVSSQESLKRNKAPTQSIKKSAIKQKMELQTKLNQGIV
jgi:hypothetical protein